jgi:hypothetical protein
VYSAPEETLHGAENFGDQLLEVCDFIQLQVEFPDFKTLGLGDNPHEHSLCIIDDQEFID